MGPLPVVVFRPGRDLDPGMGKAEEQRLVEQFVAHAAIEALNVTILHRLSGLDIMPFHTCLAAPRQDGIAGQFGSIVADNHAGFAASGDQRAKFAHNPLAREIEVSGTAARHSLVTSSTTLRTRNRRPETI